MQAQILAPAAVLVLWSLLVLIWVAATRFSGMAKAGVDIRTAPPGGLTDDEDQTQPAKMPTTTTEVAVRAGTKSESGASEVPPGLNARKSS